MTDSPISPSVADILNHGAKVLAASGAESPRLDARLLLSAAIECEPHKLLMCGESRLSEGQSEVFLKYVERRSAGEPVSRILGQREFWSLPFLLSPDTLDPRPDSETVVETALSLISNRKTSHLSVLDIGTGTGCLLLSLMSELSFANGVGTDIAVGAVNTARANALALGMIERSAFLVGDLVDAVKGSFGLILSNPPYIRSDALSGLQREVLLYDPQRALDGGVDGLSVYRRIAAELGRLLTPDGIIVLEVGYDQEVAVRSILEVSGLVRIASHRDLSGHVRCISAAAG